MPRAVVRHPGRAASWLALVILLVAPSIILYGPAANAAQKDAAGDIDALRTQAMARLTQYRKRPAPVGTLALERLARAGDASAREQLAMQARETQGVAATAALLRLGDQSQITRATQLLSDRTLNEPVQLFAALVEARATAAGSAVVPWLNASDDETVAAAAITLGRLGHTAAAPTLHALRTGSNPLLRPAASAALWRLGDQTVRPALDEALGNMLPEVRLYAAAAWAPESDGPWKGIVQQVLRDPHPPRRIAAGRLLVQVAPGAVREVLGRDMTSLTDPALRAQAAAVFERVADAADTALLSEALGNEDPEVQVHAAGAILRLTGKR